MPSHLFTSSHSSSRGKTLLLKIKRSTFPVLGFERAGAQLCFKRCWNSNGNIWCAFSDKAVSVGAERGSQVCVLLHYFLETVQIQRGFLFIPAAGVRSQHFLFPCLNSIAISGRQKFWQCLWLGLPSPACSGLQLWPAYMVSIAHARLDPSPNFFVHIQDQDYEGKKYFGGFSLNSFFFFFFNRSSVMGVSGIGGKKQTLEIVSSRWLQGQKGASWCPLEKELP